MMMWIDPIVNEIHKLREQLAAQHGNSIKALGDAARRGNLAVRTDLAVEPKILSQEIFKFGALSKR
jgi:hypothetical protein